MTGRATTWLLLGAWVLAQNVGIGTATPHASARLDVDDPNRGLLIPRVELQAANLSNPVTGPATSLLLYNTATAGTAPNNVWPGFYYWDDNRWVRLLAGTETWLITGNPGTDPSVNFLGTTDNQPLVIRVNNQRSITSGRMRRTFMRRLGRGCGLFLRMADLIPKCIST